MTDNTKKTEYYFSKDTSLSMKAITAFVLMFHHLFTFPGWYNTDRYISLVTNNIVLLRILSSSCNGIYLFLTGYFYSYSKKKNYKYSLRKITDVYLEYLIICCSACLLFFLLGKYHPSISDLMGEIFAYNNDVMYFNWYIWTYIITLLLLPLINKLKTNKWYIDLFVCLILARLLFQLSESFIANGPVYNIVWRAEKHVYIALVGFFFAEYKVYQKLFDKTINLFSSKLTQIIMLLVVASFSLLLSLATSYSTPRFQISFFPYDTCLEFSAYPIAISVCVYALIKLSEMMSGTKFAKALGYIGTHSLGIWLVSSVFFCQYGTKLKPAIYICNSVTVVLIWSTVICLLIAIPFHFISGKLNSLKNQI